VKRLQLRYNAIVAMAAAIGINGSVISASWRNISVSSVISAKAGVNDGVKAYQCGSEMA